MRTIHFKNGTSKEVSQEIIDMLIKNQLQSKFEVYTDLNGVTYLIINIEEINFID